MANRYQAPVLLTEEQIRDIEELKERAEEYRGTHNGMHCNNCNKHYVVDKVKSSECPYCGGQNVQLNNHSDGVFVQMVEELSTD